jgi:hypothetical protein
LLISIKYFSTIRGRLSWRPLSFENAVLACFDNQWSSFLTQTVAVGFAVWWAVPTAVKSHVVKRPIRRSASRSPDDKAAYDRNGSPKQDGIFAHVKIQLAAS